MFLHSYFFILHFCIFFFSWVYFQMQKRRLPQISFRHFPNYPFLPWISPQNRLLYISPTFLSSLGMCKARCSSMCSDRIWHWMRQRQHKTSINGEQKKITSCSHSQHSNWQQGLTWRTSESYIYVQRNNTAFEPVK